MTEPEKTLTVPKKRYESYRFLALSFGLYITVHFAILASDWIDWTFVAANALIMLMVLRDAYDDRRRRKAQEKADA
jgi:hypothetical protein